jgi:hypothetical protein
MEKFENMSLETVGLRANNDTIGYSDTFPVLRVLYM